MRQKGKDGKFIQQRKPWTPKKWNDGYIDNSGRFRIYRPDYPRAYGEGYALRAHVVWWMAHGKIHEHGTDLHHRNGTRLDDRLENLTVLPHGKHAALHKTKPRIQFVCRGCGQGFGVVPWRVRQRQKEGARIRYCSLGCYNSQARATSHRNNISFGLQRAYKEGRR